MNNESSQSIPHLSRSYSNIQDFMRFMDTKAGVVFTLAGLILGSIAAKPEDLTMCAKWCAVFGALGAIASMMCALRVVWPMHGPKNPDHLTMLFPALDPKARHNDGSEPDIHELILAKTAQPFTEQFVVDEFANQFSHLHSGIVRKISFLRRAIQAMVFALGCVGICLIVRVTGDKDSSIKTYEVNALINHRSLDAAQNPENTSTKAPVLSPKSEPETKSPPVAPPPSAGKP